MRVEQRGVGVDCGRLFGGVLMENRDGKRGGANNASKIQRDTDGVKPVRAFVEWPNGWKRKIIDAIARHYPARSVDATFG